MKTGYKIRKILEYFHPVFLLPWICPVGYLFYPQRSDRTLQMLYLAGFLLIICSAVSRMAAVKAVFLRTYLFLCLTAAAAVLLSGYFIGKRLFDPILLKAFLIELSVSCFWIMLSSARIRMKEKRRRRSKNENDFTWKDEPVSLKAPSLFGVICFIVVYILGLLNVCPVLCDTALAAGMIYLLIYLSYCHLSATEDYFSETGRLENVPRRKIFRIRMTVFLTLAFLIVISFLLSFQLKGRRTYRDLRTFSFKHTIDPEELYFHVPEETPEPDFSGWDPGPAESREAPAWIGWLGKIFIFCILAATVLLIFRAIADYSLEFRGAEEENGDLTISLGEDDTKKLFSKLPRIFPGPLTEREKIRREYRRTVLRYRGRKNLPKDYETPAQIEEGTPFPDSFDIRTLHETYEEARYAP